MLVDLFGIAFVVCATGSVGNISLAHSGRLASSLRHFGDENLALPAMKRSDHQGGTLQSPLGPSLGRPLRIRVPFGHVRAEGSNPKVCERFANV